MTTQYTYWVDTLDEAETLLEVFNCNKRAAAMKDLKAYGVCKFNGGRLTDRDNYEPDYCIRLRGEM